MKGKVRKYKDTQVEENAIFVTTDYKAALYGKYSTCSSLVRTIGIESFYTSSQTWMKLYE